MEEAEKDEEHVAKGKDPMSHASRAAAAHPELRAAAGQPSRLARPWVCCIGSEDETSEQRFEVATLQAVRSLQDDELIPVHSLYALPALGGSTGRASTQRRCDCWSNVVS